MREFILFLILSSNAFADDSTSAVNSARDAYKLTLQAQLEKSGEDEAWTKCEGSKSSYLSASGELERINAELAVPANPALGQAQTDYRTKLELMRKTAEAKLTKSKTDAKTAGTELATAKAKVKAVNTELARIDAEEKREKMASEPQDTSSGVIPIRRPRPPLDSHLPIGGWEVDSSSRLTRPLPTLPVEFKGCYPNEVPST